MSSPTRMRQPDFFIVGAPKSGTTAMYAYLRRHPGIFMPATKELRFFGADLDVRGFPRRTIETYLASFAPATADQQVGTAYVWYLYSRTAASEIREFNRDARVIIMLRSPADMVYSLHSEHLSNGNEDLHQFEDAIAAESDRRAGRRIPRHAHLPQGLLYSEVAKYAEQVDRYFRVFGKDRVHVILFDDFESNTSAVYGEALTFLGVDDGFDPGGFEAINPNKRVRSEGLRHMLAHPPEFPRRVIRAAVPGRLRRVLYERAGQLNATNPARLPLAQDTRGHLNEIYREDVAKLGRLLDRDLTHWVHP